MSKTELQPHQKRVLKKLEKNDKQLLYWGLGTGKTLAALSIAEKFKAPAKVIGPASLKGNFEEEAKKHKIKSKVDYSSYTKPNARKGKRYPLLIYDEAHRTGRLSSQRSRYPDKFKADKQILLTGTPIRNHPSELIPLLRGLDIDIPRNSKKFNEFFIQEKKVNPGL
jgi:superfamily II DNA or RNA helicase